MSNLKLWEKVEKTDPSHTKKVTFGRGFTAIDPYYQIRCATEQFGPAGEGWGWEVVRVEEFREIHSIGLLIRLWHGEKGNYIEQWGQGALYTDKNNSKPDHDVLKKATTDGITKCLSYLGFNADVFTGKFDDNKYVQQMAAEFKEQIAPDPIDNEKVLKAATWFKEKMDEDVIDQEISDKFKSVYQRLTNDEQIAVHKELDIKVPENKNGLMYKNLLKKYLEYHPAREVL